MKSAEQTNEDITLLSLELRFSDGEVRKITGNDAQEWFDAVCARDQFCAIHGMRFPKLNWSIQREEIP